MARAVQDVQPPNPVLGLLGYVPGIAGTNPVQTIETPVKATVATGEFLAKLSDPRNWVRVAEGLVGIILIGVGINAMLKNPVGRAAGGVVGGPVKSVVGSQIRNVGTRNIRAQEDRRYAQIAQSRESARSVGASQREAVRSRGQAQRELFRTEQVKARRKGAS